MSAENKMPEKSRKKKSKPPNQVIKIEEINIPAAQLTETGQMVHAELDTNLSIQSCEETHSGQYLRVQNIQKLIEIKKEHGEINQLETAQLWNAFILLKDQSQDLQAGPPDQLKKEIDAMDPLYIEPPAKWTTVEALQPPTTPVESPPRRSRVASVGPSTTPKRKALSVPGHPRRQTRRSFNDFESFLNRPDSGSEDSDESDEDENECEPADATLHNLRFAARKLREMEVLIEEKEADALAEFYEETDLLEAEVAMETVDAVEVADREGNIPSGSLVYQFIALPALGAATDIEAGEGSTNKMEVSMGAEVAGVGIGEGHKPSGWLEITDVGPGTGSTIEPEDSTEAGVGVTAGVGAGVVGVGIGEGDEPSGRLLVPSLELRAVTDVGAGDSSINELKVSKGAGSDAKDGKAGMSTTFSWSADFSTFRGIEEVYLRKQKPKIKASYPVQFFSAVWDVPIVEKIVEETNRYAWDYIAKLTEINKPISRSLGAWVETTVDEIYRLFALFNYMALDYRSRIDEYWTTGVLGMPKFREIMSRDRFIILTHFLHFIDNDTISPFLRAYDRKIAKISPILNHCNAKFGELYTPSQKLCLDESLLLWKGSLSWVQCIRAKAARFGIKSFELCEAETGYMLRSLLYAGKGSSMVEGAIHGFENPSAKVVVELMEGYLDLGHSLVMDNWYNQLILARFLKSRKTDVFGTMNRRRSYLPPEITTASEARMCRGEQIARHCGDIALIAWKDVKLVTLISTYHNAKQIVCRRGGVEINKPVVVDAYNKSMGGVDLKDQMISGYRFERIRGNKWYMNVFKRLLNTSILNTFVIYKKSWRLPPLTHRSFRYAISEGLLAAHTPPRVEKPLPASVEARLDGVGHWPCLTAAAPEGQGRNYTRRRCARCSKLGKRTTVKTMCSKCNVPLCIDQCYEEYHTLKQL